jgi:hypothetical protein
MRGGESGIQRQRLVERGDGIAAIGLERLERAFERFEGGGVRKGHFVSPGVMVHGGFSCGFEFRQAPILPTSWYVAKPYYC